MRFQSREGYKDGSEHYSNTKSGKNSSRLRFRDFGLFKHKQCEREQRLLLTCMVTLIHSLYMTSLALRLGLHCEECWLYVLRNMECLSDKKYFNIQTAAVPPNAFAFLTD